MLPLDFEIQYKKGKENVVVDSLSKVGGAELMTLMIPSVLADLRQEITTSWDSDPELKALIASLSHTPQEHYFGQMIS